MRYLNYLKNYIICCKFTLNGKLKQLWYELTNLPPDFQYLINDHNLRSSFRFLLHSQSIQPQMLKTQMDKMGFGFVIGLWVEVFSEI